MTESENILQRLRGAKFRITPARQLLIEFLCDCRQPASAAECISYITSKKARVNKTTIYRELDFLLDQQILSEIDLLDGKKRYEILREDSHHHHLVCTKCKDILCIELPEDLDSLEKKIFRSHDFKVKSHVLEFFGLCSDCR